MTPTPHRESLSACPLSTLVQHSYKTGTLTRPLPHPGQDLAVRQRCTTPLCEHHHISKSSEAIRHPDYNQTLLKVLIDWSSVALRRSWELVHWPTARCCSSRSPTYERIRGLDWRGARRARWAPCGAPSAAVPAVGCRSGPPPPGTPPLGGRPGSVRGFCMSWRGRRRGLRSARRTFALPLALNNMIPRF